MLKCLGVRNVKPVIGYIKPVEVLIMDKNLFGLSIIKELFKRQMYCLNQLGFGYRLASSPSSKNIHIIYDLLL